MESTRPLWVDPKAQSYPPLTEDIRADAVVIGGGISGAAACRWLVESGIRDVVLLEGRTVASGASGRNAGFVMALAPENFPPTNDAGDLEIARRIWSFTEENQRLIEATIQDLGIECEYRRRGSLGLAASDEEWEWIKASSNIAQAAGIDVGIVDRDDLPAPWLRENYFGGARYPCNAEMHPGLFVRGVVESLAHQGVRVFERTDVTWFEPSAGTWILGVQRACDGQAGSTGQGSSRDDRTPLRVRCQRIVLATNAYTKGLLPRLPINPVRGQVLATVPLPMTIADSPVYANHGFQYWRQTQDGRLVLGGWRDLDTETEVGTQEVLNETIQTQLNRVAEGLCGEGVDVEYRWSGIMGFTPDRLPLVGLIPESANLAIAAGYSGHGLAMAFLCARHAVQELLGATSELHDLFDPVRGSC